MCGSMVDIQYPTAENRRGKKEEETTGVKYNGLPVTIGGHNYVTVTVCIDSLAAD